jgi:single-stranded-DNA-specific exonuclease
MSLALRTSPPQWVLAEEPDPQMVADLVEATSLPSIIVKILVNRGLTNPEKIDRFLHPELADLKDPFSMTGMEAGIDRVTRALYENEKVMIYGDYDVDGITATSLLYQVLNKLGGQVDFYLPNRLTQGYGLSIEGIDKARDQGVTLIITVDTGITAVEEVEYARSQ